MSNLRFIQLSNYVRPDLREDKGKNWVLNGRNNDFYQDIIDRKNGSPTNNAIINSYVSLIYGKGLMDSNGANNVSNWLKFKTMISPKEVRKIVSDFKLFGEASIQVIKANRRNELPTLLHLPKNKVVPSIENEEGIIEGYWYCRDWNHKNQNPPEYYPTFGTSNENIEIYNIKPYTAGKEYFSDPDWLSGFAYAIMEEEISNLYVNCIKRGLSAGYIVNIPDGNSLTDEEKDRLEKQIKQKLTGSSNAGTFVINFKGGTEDITVTVMPVNDNIHKQWEYLTTEARQQLLTAHQVTSPMLFGIKDGSGFGNNAEELNEAFELLMDSVINPMQLFITEAFEEIANFYDVRLNLVFKPLRTIQKDEPLTLAKQEKEFNVDSIADGLVELGEEIGDDFELIDEIDAETFDLKESQLNNLIEFAKAPTANTSRKSRQDTSLFLIRYRYAGNPNPQREFCKKVMSANRVYRYEDLENASNITVNAGFGKNGADTYNIAFYKGGVNCRHWWKREIYLKKNQDKISVNQARKMILALDPKDRKKAQWEQNDKKVAQVAEQNNNYHSLTPNYRNSGASPN